MMFLFWEAMHKNASPKQHCMCVHISSFEATEEMPLFGVGSTYITSC